MEEKEAEGGTAWEGEEEDPDMETIRALCMFKNIDTTSSGTQAGKGKGRRGARGRE